MRYSAWTVLIVLAACSGEGNGTSVGDTGTGSSTGATTQDPDADGTTAGPQGTSTDSGVDQSSTATSGDTSEGTGSTTGTETDTDTGPDPDMPGLDERPPNPTCIAPDSFPQWLSQTGCVDPSDATAVVEGVIPYEVNHPFWSDGAQKSRWLAIPDGTTITVDPMTGDWDFPPGTVLMKEFQIDGTRVETRLLVRRAGGSWQGQGYAWDDTQTDAQKTSGGITVNGIDWDIPSSNDCLKCHTGGAGFSLGPETMQMNRDTTYPSTGRTANQILTYDAIGMFSAPQGDPALLPVLPSRDGAEPVEDRARAYIHANCSMCHRPGEEELYDGRYTTPFANQGLCGVAPTKGDLGDPINQLIYPGSAANSVVVLRMESLGGPRMPLIGSYVVDDDGVALLSEWIDGLAGCP